MTATLIAPLITPQRFSPAAGDDSLPLLLKPFTGQIMERPPVWFMRQAGRYMAEYRAIRSKVSFLELCKNPELSAEVSLQPWQAFNTDAVIMFCDILIPPEAMGMALDFTDHGPVFANPLRSAAEVDALRVPDPNESMPFVMDLIRRLRSELAGSPETALIGFAGAPWTLACYMIEGGTSKNFRHIKAWMYEDPASLHRLLDKLADTVIVYLNAQIAAGAQMVQLFDTWGGLLDEHGYRTFIMPYQKKVLDGLHRAQAPAVLYMNNGAHLLPAVLETTPDGLSVDDRTSLITLRSLANAHNQTALALQGNLDPIAMLSRPEVLKPLVQANLITGGNTNYIFNVGHGLIPQTPLDNVKRVVEWIRSGELTTV